MSGREEVIEREEYTGDDDDGGDLYSSTSQLNLSRSCH
jgi:hypothetical protein